MSTSAPGPDQEDFLLTVIESVPAARARAEAAARAEAEKAARHARWANTYAGVREQLGRAMRPVFEAPEGQQLTDSFGLTDALRAWGDALAERDGFPEAMDDPKRSPSDPDYPYRHLDANRQPGNVTGCAELKVGARLLWGTLKAVRESLGWDAVAVELARAAMNPGYDLRTRVAVLLANPDLRRGFGAVLTLAEQLGPTTQVILVDDQPYNFVPGRPGRPGKWWHSEPGAVHDRKRVARLAWIARGYLSNSLRVLEELGDLFPWLVLSDVPSLLATPTDDTIAGRDEAAAEGNSILGSVEGTARSEGHETGPAPAYESASPSEPVTTPVGTDVGMVVGRQADGPTPGYGFHFNGQSAGFAKGERKLYRLLCLMWPSYRTKGSQHVDDLMTAWKDISPREISAKGLGNYCGPLSSILANRFGVPARLEKDGDYICWQPTAAPAPK